MRFLNGFVNESFWQRTALLLTLLNDPSEQVCQAAIKALGTLSDPRAIPALIPLLAHRAFRIR